MLFLDCPEEVMEKRMLARGRSDDTAATIKKRWVGAYVGVCVDRLIYTHQPKYRFVPAISTKLLIQNQVPRLRGGHHAHRGGLRAGGEGPACHGRPAHRCVLRFGSSLGFERWLCIDIDTLTGASRLFGGLSIAFSSILHNTCTCPQTKSTPTCARPSSRSTPRCRRSSEPVVGGLMVFDG